MGTLGRFVADTLGGNLLQFARTFLLWINADRLGLSAVVAVVACAMTIASRSDGLSSARSRVQSYPVSTAVVFVLNAVAFLMMACRRAKSSSI